MERKYSRQREIIKDYIYSVTCHPSAEQIYEVLRSANPRMSLATVYRNLALFRENREIVSVAVVNGHERFDGNIAPHSHFICRSCGKVIDIQADNRETGWLDITARKNGVEIDEYEQVFYGRCGDCL